MNELLSLAIGSGLTISLIFSELFGIAPGGLIVPGYIALYMHRPLDVFITMLLGLITFALVHALSSITIVYGRRRTVLMILVGCLLGMLCRGLLDNQTYLPGEHLSIIGYIIPGLIAIWYDRQGIVTTSATLLIVSAIVRLTLVIAVGTDLKL